MGKELDLTRKQVVEVKIFNHDWEGEIDKALYRVSYEPDIFGEEIQVSMGEAEIVTWGQKHAVQQLVVYLLKNGKFDDKDGSEMKIKGLGELKEDIEDFLCMGVEDVIDEDDVALVFED